MSWNFTKQDFAAAQVFDFASVGAGAPLEMYFSADAKTMYVSTGKPGQLHQSDRSCALAALKLAKSMAAGEGAHHLGFTKDSRYGFVQNALPNLSRLSDGAVTVGGLSKGRFRSRWARCKKAGSNPNSLLLRPPWDHLAGH